MSDSVRPVDAVGMRPVKSLRRYARARLLHGSKKVVSREKYSERTKML